MSLFGYHTQSYLGLGIGMNDRPFPDGMVDHVRFVVGILLLLHGAVAVVRDLLRLRRKLKARALAG